MKARIGIVGPNGAGKSTLLRLLVNSVEPVDGSVVRRGKCRIGYFTQHHLDQLSLDLCALADMRKLLGSEPTDEELRGRLGRFGISGDLATQCMRNLSGGQKSRVAMAKICVTEPHLLVLDEPTNNLDVETIDALCEALTRFNGSVTVVSHDQRLMQRVCNELWVCDGQGGVEPMVGSFLDYKRSVTRQINKFL